MGSDCEPLDRDRRLSSKEAGVPDANLELAMMTPSSRRRLESGCIDGEVSLFNEVRCVSSMYSSECVVLPGK
jgi:hypothetical protein